MEEIKSAISKAFDAVSFDRIVIVGLLVVLIMTITASFLVPALSLQGEESKFILAFFKDVALIIVGALANSLRNRWEKEGGQ